MNKKAHEFQRRINASHAAALPDRIWVMKRDQIWRWHERPVEDEECVEYVRADLARDGTRPARAHALTLNPVTASVQVDADDRWFGVDTNSVRCTPLFCGQCYQNDPDHEDECPNGYEPL